MMGDSDFGMLNDKIQELQQQFGPATDGIIQNAVMSARATAEQVAQHVREQAEQQREQAQIQREQAQRIREEAQRQREEAQRVSERAREEARRAAEQIKITTLGGLKTTRIDLGRAQIVFSDEKGELRVEKSDGKNILTAKDPQGRLLFSGPVETKEDLDKVPAEVRQRFEQLQQRDLPGVVSSDDQDDSDADMDADSEGNNDGDEDGGEEDASVQTISVQVLPQNLWAYRTILI
jgi:hypothetical protein